MNDLTYLLALMIIVTIHEFGHYFMGRWYGVTIWRLQIFYFPIWSYKPKESKPHESTIVTRTGRDGRLSVRRRTSWRDTTYSLGWIPFGGYTQYDGIGYNNQTPFHRLMMSIAGVMFNLLTAIIIYILIVLMSDGLSGSGFWHTLSAALEFIWIATISTFSHVLSFVGMSLPLPSVSESNYDLIMKFLGTSSEFGFLSYIADLSCVLAFINLLPIPPLDGGQAVFDIYEIIAGRKPSEKFKRNSMIVGAVLFLLIFWVLPILRR